MWRCCATRRQSPTLLGNDSSGAASSSASTKAPAAATELVGAFNEVLTPGFWESFKARKPVHHPGALADVPQIMDLDAIFSAMVHGGENGATAAFKSGEMCMRESIYMAYLDQATLSLAEAEKYFPDLLKLCQGLAPHFGFVSARLVLDPPNVRVPPLQAEGDVFVLSLWGEQPVTIARPVKGLPMTAPRPGPLLQCMCRPGDVLFVPSGVECRTSPPKPMDKPHIEADSWKASPGGASSSSSSPAQPAEGAWNQPRAEPCLYVILTVRTNEHSLGTSLSRYMNDMLRADKLSEDANKFFRSVPTKRDLLDRYPDAASAPGSGGSASGSEPRQKFEAQLQAYVTELASKLTAADLRKHFEQRMEKLRQEQLESAEKTHRSIAKAPRPLNFVTSTSSIRVAKGISCQCTAGSSTALFKRGPETLQLPIYPSASYTISELCDGRPHMVDTLTCTDPVERLCVLQVLVFKECLEICAGLEDGPEDASAYSGSFS